MHHYLSMAKGVFENELAGPEVRLKKYFYALRPILACRWIADRATIPPMELGKLRVSLSDELNEILDDLLKQKAEANEKSIIERIGALDHFIAEHIAYAEKMIPSSSAPDIDNKLLNETFRKFIV
jgi:predicted nucleotidyltransferase